MATTRRVQRPGRFKAGVAALSAGIVLAVAVMAAPALADDPLPFTFGAGYDAYLKVAHRGTVATANQNSSESSCPDVTSLEGETGWHFVLDGNTNDFVTVDAAFELDGIQI